VEASVFKDRRAKQEADRQEIACERAFARKKSHIDAELGGQDKTRHLTDKSKYLELAENEETQRCPVWLKT